MQAMSNADDLLVSRVSFERVTRRTSVQDQESLPSIDQIPTARASVAMLDKLWTQIDVLDDVKAMAEAVNEHGSFFTEEFSSSLRQMKESQKALLDKVIAHQKAGYKAREERERTNENMGSLPKNEVSAEQENEVVRQRMNDFFSQPPKSVSDNPKLRDFEELDQYIGEVKTSLHDVHEQMKSFDDVRRKLWQ